MTLIHYILLVDFVILIISIRIIFKGFSTFGKSLMFHFFPHDIADKPLDQWADKEDIAHRINLLYAVILGLFGLSFFIFNMA